MTECFVLAHVVSEDGSEHHSFGLDLNFPVVPQKGEEISLLATDGADCGLTLTVQKRWFEVDAREVGVVVQCVPLRGDAASFVVALKAYGFTPND